jgi:hypothetical protein
MYVHKERAQQTTEQLAALQKAGERQKLVATEILEQHTMDSVEGVTVPPEHKMVSSAWHSIEMDKRTGRPVESPTFAYGHEYYRERAHENRPSDQRNAAAGGVALAAAASATDDRLSGQSVAPGSSKSYTPSTTTQRSAQNRRKNMANTIRGQLAKGGNTGPIWPYLLALVVILFCLLALLN